MLSKILANFYARDIQKLIEEISLFRNEEDLWKTAGSVKNSCGNLALHIIGGTNHHIGLKLGGIPYTRHRDEEFSRKGVARSELVTGLQKLIPMVTGTLSDITDLQMEADFPTPFDDLNRSTSYVLTQLLLHLNYHLGQINYLRRILE